MGEEHYYTEQDRDVPQQDKYYTVQLQSVSSPVNHQDPRRLHQSPADPITPKQWEPQLQQSGHQGHSQTVDDRQNCINISQRLACAQSISASS